MSLSFWALRLRTLLATGLPALLLGSSVASGSSALASYQAPAKPPLRVGVYYFPGWDGSANRNWEPIKRYPERTPLLGWYDGADSATMRRQLDWMKTYGISYVAFDWYWENGDVHGDGALKAYLRIPANGVDFAVMWANDRIGIGQEEWRKIVKVWVDRYLKLPNYLMLNKQPVVFILSQQTFDKNAQDAGSSPVAYIQDAQKIARDAGLPGINLVAGFDDLSYTLVSNEAPAQGFGAVSAYNFHRPPWRPQRPGWNKLTHGYAKLDQAYRENWVEGLTSKLPVVVPMTTGWDKRPWGGSADPLHDRSVATPAEFRAHLIAARQIMLKSGKAHSGLGVICCWNEYGEGSYLEPTRSRGFALLEQVRAVFQTR